MAKEDTVIIETFKNVVVEHLKDLAIALPALIPQTKEDEMLFREGMEKISQLVYNLEHCDNVREISKYLDAQRIVEDFDEESIMTLRSRIKSSARESVNSISSMMYNIGDE